MPTISLRRPALAGFLLAAFAAAPTADALPRTPAVPVTAARVAVDPTGVFDWAIEAQGQVFSGTLTVTKANDTTYTATIAHLTLGASVKANAVKLEGDVLTVVSTTEYGDLTQQIKFADPLQGQWQIGDGAMGGGMKVVRQPKKP